MALRRRVRIPLLTVFLKFFNFLMSKKQFFFPLEINFNSFFNTYFLTTPSITFSFRSFQPKFYEFIKLRTISISHGFANSQKFKTFISFRNPANLFRPSLLSESLRFEIFFQNEYFFFLKKNFFFVNSNISTFLTYYFTDSQKYFYFSRFPYNYQSDSYMAKKRIYSAKYNSAKFLLTTPNQIMNFFSFITLPVSVKFTLPFNFNQNYVKQSFSDIKQSSLFNYSFFDKKFSNISFFSFFFPFLNIYPKLAKIISYENYFFFDDLFTTQFNGSLLSENFKFEDDGFFLKRIQPRIHYNYSTFCIKYTNFSIPLLSVRRCFFLYRFNQIYATTRFF